MMLDPLALFASTLLGKTEATFWLPEAVSNQTGHVDGLFYFIYWLSVIFFVGIVTTMFWFMWRYQRRTPGQQADAGVPSHSTIIEVVWTGIPLMLAIYLFYMGFGGYVYLAVPPAETYTVNVTGKKWTWTFGYDTGFSEAGAVHVWAYDEQRKEDKPIRFLISADDVLHSVYIPASRGKMAAVPGPYTSMWFTVPRENLPASVDQWDEVEFGGQSKRKFRVARYHLTCTEYCGTEHSNMMATVYVHPDKASFDEWLRFVSSWDDGTTQSYLARGEQLYKQNCAVCHNLDGPVKVGPNWKELAGLLKSGGKRQTSAGELTVDENYIRTSIVEPAAALVSGFAGGMPTFKGQLKDNDIRAVTTYIRSLAE